MTTTIKLAVLAAAFLSASCGPATAPPPATDAASTSSFAARPSEQWRLPAQLREISGLASTSDGRLFAHDDEQAILYEIDPLGGRIVKSFRIGSPAIRDDFEGLAITPDGSFWLLTSTGGLLRFTEGAANATVPYQRYQTGMREGCDAEGLAFSPATEASPEGLIIACKDNRGEHAELFIWALQERSLRPWMSLPSALLCEAASQDSCNLSAVEIDPRSGRIVLLAARQRVLAELSPDGAILSSRQLGAEHVQAEALAILPDGSLIVGDEGPSGAALLSRYARRP